ncbi:MAG TPA: hydroxyacid dehydrogenase, partial [Gemmataceae bacterium]|nr:hydroxyacid dehydrogenase [Gemmataceae bacterium]
MPRVLICDKLESSGLELLKQAGLEVDNRPGLKGDELKTALRASDGCIVRSGTRLTAEFLEEPGKLRAIARAGVGVDNIDVAAATRRGIVVMNTPGGNTTSTAEHAIALLTALARHVPAADASMKAGKWDRGKFVGTQLAGKALGIVGVGRVGREVARRAVAMDMRVLGMDPFLTPERAAEIGVEKVDDLDALLPRCDFLTVHTPGGPETKGMIGPEQIAKFKKGARVINCARGGIIDETALAAALTSGQIAAAGIDVYDPEPPPADNPLLKAPNTVLTPHLGASTLEAQ